MKVQVSDVIVGSRFRKDMGDVEKLTQSFVALGQLQPIGITPDNQLVFGARRLVAAKRLGWAQIEAKEVDCDALLAEQDENEVRKAFTVSEQVAIAEAMVESLQGRGLKHLKQHRSGNISGTVEIGESRDIAAAKTGLGSGKTLEAAIKVVAQGSDKLVQAMDAKQVSINAASKLSNLSPERQDAIDYNDANAVRKATSALTKSKRDGVAKATRTPTVDHSRIFSQGSLSAMVLANRAIRVISQIGKLDPNAIAAIDSIRAALDQQRTIVKGN